LQCAVAAFFHAAQVFVRSFIHVIRPFRFHVLVPSVDRIPRRLNHHPYRTYPRFRLPTASSSSSHSAPMRAPHGSAMVSIPRTGVKDAGSPQDVIPRGYAPSLEIPQQLPCSHPQSPPPPAAAASMPIFAKMIRAPFNYTLRFDSSGINVAMLSVPGRGHIYWGTSLFPRDDALIERGDPSTAPQPVRIAMRELCRSSQAIASTATLWILRGNMLPYNFANFMHSSILPEEVLERFQVGFFDFVPGVLPSIPYSPKLHRRVLRLHRVLAERGGHALGVRQMENGCFRFSLRRILDMLTCSSDTLAALIADNSKIGSCFSGKTSYAAKNLKAEDNFGGLICLIEGMPAGSWMTGRFRDTGFGLLCRSEDIYYRINNKGKTCSLERIFYDQLDFLKWKGGPLQLADVIE